jgi:mRNA interferase MazF
MLGLASTTMTDRSINRGDLFWIGPDGSRGPEAGYAHPHVVVQDDVFNHSRIATVVVCALTTNLHRANEPGNVLLDAGEGNLSERSVVVVSQIASIERGRLGVRIGSLSGHRVDQIVAGLRFQQASFFGADRESPGASLRIRVVESAAERSQAFDIRARVFVDEQGIAPELERDGHDEACTHVLGTMGGVPVATARYRRTREGWKLERVAVLRERRGAGIGAALVRHACSALSGDSIHVHAQIIALAFWESLGFVPEGELFEEAGFPHRLMRLRRP